MVRVRRHTRRVLPLLILLGLYWPGLTNWFYQDDFGWLNLRREVHSFRDLGPALFAPKAHGNLRPLGENAYFLVFSSLFGVDALPFRIWAFATEMASLLLLGSIVRRITLSEAAGFWAQIFWVANAGLAPAMCWTSIYNQILSGFFLLLAFYFLLRHVETGAARFYAVQWAAFVMGLGALETNVVYPAIAAAYAWMAARTYLKKIVPMFAVSALAVILHLRFAPLPREGVYAVHLDGRLFRTLADYWMRALGPSRPVMIVLSLALLATLVSNTRRKQWAGLFGLAWFVIAMGPYLPLPDHQMDYYLAVPAIGLAILGAWALATAWRSSKFVWRGAGIVGAAAFLATSVPSARAVAKWHHERGTRVEALVLGVAEVHRIEPDKMILLAGVDNDLFWSGIADAPFRVMEIPHVYLVPGSEERIQGPAGLAIRYVLPEGLSLRALRARRAVVYDASGPVLRNATSRYRAIAESLWRDEPPRFINLGDSAFGEFLGAGWSECADGYRALPGAAAVQMGGPRRDGERLYVTVFRAAGVRLGVHADGAEAPLELIGQDNGVSEFRGNLPPASTGKNAVDLWLSNGSPEPLRFGFLEIR